MKFNIANKAPIVVTIDGTEYKFRPISRPFWVEWAASLDAARLESAMNGLDTLQRSKMQLVYGIEPTLHSELVRRIYTPDGTGRIIRESGAKGGVPQAVVDGLLENGDERELETLALMLASIADVSELRVAGKMDGEGDAAGESPLASSPTD